MLYHTQRRRITRQAVSSCRCSREESHCDFQDLHYCRRAGGFQEPAIFALQQMVGARRCKMWRRSIRATLAAPPFLHFMRWAISLSHDDSAHTAPGMRAPFHYLFPPSNTMMGFFIARFFIYTLSAACAKSIASLICLPTTTFEAIERYTPTVLR